jgi:hypothetical protein
MMSYPGALFLSRRDLGNAGEQRNSPTQKRSGSGTDRALYYRSLYKNCGRAVAWNSNEIRAWIEERMSERDGALVVR